MNKKRIGIPKSVADKVLKEYRHRCSMCGRHDPQLHHIDEDPSNNDSENLLPLCPNCHLQDTHAPTAPLDPQKIRLFRRCKDPFILDPRFHPIWLRLKYLRQTEDERVILWEWSCNDLTLFIKSLHMGDYYSLRINAVLQHYVNHFVVHLRQQGQVVDDDDIIGDPSRHEELYNFRATAIEDLCVEMLRYQNWKANSTNAN